MQIIHMSVFLKNRYMSLYPAFNVKQCDEPVTVDTVYSCDLAIDDGSK